MGRMKERGTGGPVTLGDLVQAGIGLRVWCRACSRAAVVPVDQALVASFGATREVPSLRGRCRRCGKADADVRPDYKTVSEPITRP